MTFLRDMLDDLRSRPLLLLAALALLGALVAVIVLLGKPVEKPTAVAPAAPLAGAPAQGQVANISQTPQAVSQSDPFNQKPAKSVRIFPRHNPFRSRAPLPSTLGTEAGASTDAGTTGTGTDTGGTDTGTGTTGTDTGTGTGTGGGGTVKFYTWIAKVRFGEQGKKQRRRTLDGLESLPSTNNPVLVFLGVAGGEQAVFLVSSSATTTGDGTCQPSDTACTFLYMKTGDTQRIEAISSDGDVTTYRLKLTKIAIKRVDNPSASSSKTGGSSENVPPTGSAVPAPGPAGRSAKPAKQVSTGISEKRKQRRKAERQAKRLVGVFGGLGF
jgi:hypothetical protein